jgi:hypothetical protein
MSDACEVVDEANRLAKKDEAALELLLGMRARAIEENPSLQDDVDFEPEYDQATMGRLDDVRALGRNILKRWNKELHGLVCGEQAANQKERAAILGALNLGEAAVIGAVATASLGLGVPAPIAAVVAPLIVGKFIWPAKDELCAGWAEGIKGQG